MWTGFEDKATWEPGGLSAHSRPFWPSGLQERARTTLWGGRPREEGVVPAAEGPGGGPWDSSQRTRSHGQGTHRVLRDKHVEVQAVLADSRGRGRPGTWLPAAAPADTDRLTSGGNERGDEPHVPSRPPGSSPRPLSLPPAPPQSCSFRKGELGAWQGEQGAQHGPRHGPVEGHPPGPGPQPREVCPRHRTDNGCHLRPWRFFAPTVQTCHRTRRPACLLHRRRCRAWLSSVSRPKGETTSGPRSMAA